MTDCPDGEIRDRLPDLLHGRLSAVDRTLLEAHVAACADCQAELALLRSVRGVVHRSPGVDVGTIVASLPAYRATVQRRWGGWRAAAAVAAIAIGGTSVAVVRHAPSTTTVAVSAPAIVRPSPSPTPESGLAAPAPTVVAKASRTARASARGELAVSGAVSDLSDRELASLLGDIESLDVLPPADVDVTPLVPATSGGPAGESS